MLKVIFLILYFCLQLSKGQLRTGHQYLMERFRESAQPAALLSVETKYIKQPIDHSNAGTGGSWDMMYCQNMDKWASGGPIFVYIGGEGALSPYTLAGGLVYELAEETKGAMFATEHRFYGDSKPFNDITVAELKYLSARQALADIANLIKQIKKAPEFNTSKVVVIGGSYAGNLAAWMRLKYPELVDAAVASSAPVLAKLDFFEYFDTVADAFQKYSAPECFQRITDEMSSCSDAFNTHDGINQLKQKYQICDSCDMTKKLNQEIFFMAITVDYASAAQYGTTDGIKNYCNSHEITRKSDECNDYEFSHLYNTDIPVSQYGFWMYQTCNEFGYYMTAPNKQPFSRIKLDVDLWVRECGAIYGSQFTKETIENNIQETNSMYSGLTPAVTNVIFVHGEIDPWHRLGVTADLSETVPARMILGASHCMDLLSDNDLKISDEVKKVKQEEKILIKKWIGL